MTAKKKPNKNLEEVKYIELTLDIHPPATEHITNKEVANKQNKYKTSLELNVLEDSYVDHNILE